MKQKISFIIYWSYNDDYFIIYYFLGAFSDNKRYSKITFSLFISQKFYLVGISHKSFVPTHNSHDISNT